MSTGASGGVQAASHTLYITAGSGNSYKPVQVLAQRGAGTPAVHCHLQPVDVLGGETRRPDFLAINPRGQVPFLLTDRGERLGESNAIAWYLAEGSALIPAAPLHRAQAIQWMIFEQTALEPNISPARFFSTLVPALREANAARFPGWLDAGHAGLALLDAHLAEREFLCDSGYGIADIAVFGYTHLAREGGFDLDRHPAVLRWIERVRSQPGHRPVADLLQPLA
jgi:glutathione S-transferase